MTILKRRHRKHQITTAQSVGLIALASSTALAITYHTETQPTWLTVATGLINGAALMWLLIKPRPPRRRNPTQRPNTRNKGDWPTVPSKPLLNPLGRSAARTPAASAPRKPEPLTPQRMTRAKLAAAQELADLYGYGADLRNLWTELDEAAS